MAFPVVTGATISCTQGATGMFKATSQTMVSIAGITAATIMDVQPLVNIGACGLCISMLNPQVATATTASLGVLTPMPCFPATAGAWMCAGHIMVSGKPVLTSDGTLLCPYGGSIKIVNAGQTAVRV